MNSQNMPRVAVLIPAYNAEKTIARLVSEALHYVKTVMVVDDGSSDQTVNEAKRFGCTVVRHDQNKGKGGALRTGFDRLALMDVDWIIIMDADGQHLPSDIPKFLNAICAGEFSFLNGTRLRNPEKMPRIRLYTNKLMSHLMSMILGIQISDTQCGFKAFKSELIRKGRFRSQHFEIEDEIIFEAVRLKMNLGHVEVETVYSDEESYINPVTDTYRFISFLIRYVLGR